MTGDHHHVNLQEDDYQSSRIDTKSKLILTIVFIITTTLIISYEQLVFIGLFVIFLMMVYRVNVLSVTIKAALPFPLVISLSILAYFSDLGDNILRFGEVALEYDNLEITIFLFLRSMLIIYGAICLVESEDSFFEIIYALDDLGLPETLVSLLLIMYRTSLDLMVEAKRMIDVRYSRSTYKRWGTNLYTFRIIGYMVGNVLVRSFLKKDIRKDALYSRNFKGTLYHREKPFRFHGLLLLWVGIIVLLVILLAADIRFIGVGNKI